MKTQLLDDQRLRTFAIVFDTGEEVAEGLRRFATENNVTGASFAAIGAFQDATLAFFELATREYVEIPITEQVEVVSMNGNIGTYEGEPRVHAHAVVGRRDGSTRGGHLLRAHVRPTLEVVVTETPAYLRRTQDPKTGLPLLDLNAAETAK